LRTVTVRFVGTDLLEPLTAPLALLFRFIVAEFFQKLNDAEPLPLGPCRTAT